MIPKARDHRLRSKLLISFGNTDNNEGRFVPSINLQYVQKNSFRSTYIQNDYIYLHNPILRLSRETMIHNYNPCTILPLIKLGSRQGTLFFFFGTDCHWCDRHHFLRKIKEHSHVVSHVCGGNDVLAQRKPGESCNLKKLFM